MLKLYRFQKLDFCFLPLSVYRPCWHWLCMRHQTALCPCPVSVTEINRSSTVAIKTFLSFPLFKSPRASGHFFSMVTGSRSFLITILLVWRSTFFPWKTTIFTQLARMHFREVKTPWIIYILQTTIWPSFQTQLENFGN